MKRNRREVIALDANKLMVKIIEKGFTICSIATLLDIEKTTMRRKLNDTSKLTIREVMTLKNILELSDREAITIFLGA